MSGEHLAGKEPTQEVIGYETRLRNMAAEEGVPEGVISDTGFRLTAQLLEKIHRDHGDSTKDTYKHRHNEEHSLDFIRYFWALWKPLSEELPDMFDRDGFELGMIVGAGHDIVYSKRGAKERPGHNERESAQLVSGLMLEHGYAEAKVQRVYDAIVKTTVEYKNGIVTQTHMRQGSKDILGLCVGQADMNGALIKGPSELVRMAYAVWLEEHATIERDTSVKALLSRSVSFARFLGNQKQYYATRIAVLSDDLRHYVDDEAQRAIIVNVYKSQFQKATLRTLETVDAWERAPQQTLQAVEDSFNYAARLTTQGIERLAAVPHYLTAKLKLNRPDDD
jgi:hypothetical protein